MENVTVLPNANDGFLRQLYHPILGPLAALAADSTSEERYTPYEGPNLAYKNSLKLGI